MEQKLKSTSGKYLTKDKSLLKGNLVLFEKLESGDDVEGRLSCLRLGIKMYKRETLYSQSFDNEVITDNLLELTNYFFDGD